MRNAFERTILRLGFLVLTMAFLQNCSAVYLSRDVQSIQRTNLVMGSIYSSSSWDGRVVAVAFRKHNGKIDIGDFTVLHAPGPYELVALHEDFYIFAFEDRNQNLVYDAGEPAGQYYRSIWPSLTDDTCAMRLDIHMSVDRASWFDFPIGVALSKSSAEQTISSLPGAVVSLEEDIFSQKNGKKGYWSPKAFFKDIGTNVYFLWPYTPDKTPVLFIHGVSGSPRGWRYFIEHMDLGRFQPWVFYYPSGAPLELVSDLLYRKLIFLKQQYHFKNLYVTAHSMGGLVARALIIRLGEELPVVQLLIAISTPWGGDKMAGYGIQQSPFVIPCWRDLQPEGAFLKSLYTRAMPKETDFYIFFGHRGNRNPLRSNNDGTLTLASMLDLRSQSEAHRVYGFNENHESIIHSKEVLSYYNTILRMKDRKYN
jgi:pimeloyl-ACP methyl ester carboxylesterase